jgi:hypothetical protein
MPQPYRQLLEDTLSGLVEEHEERGRIAPERWVEARRVLDEEGVPEKLAQPTFAVTNDPAGTWRTEVYVLGPDQSCHLPYTRRDGSYHSGPGLVLVQHSPFGTTVVERDLGDPDTWTWVQKWLEVGLHTVAAPEKPKRGRRKVAA